MPSEEIAPAGHFLAMFLENSHYLGVPTFTSTPVSLVEVETPGQCLFSNFMGKCLFTNFTLENSAMVKAPHPSFCFLLKFKGDYGLEPRIDDLTRLSSRNVEQ